MDFFSVKHRLFIISKPTILFFNGVSTFVIYVLRTTY